MGKQYYTTGYFGIPGRYGGVVHICQPGGVGSVPVCGTSLSRRTEYQPCTAGIHEEYLECERCKDWLVRYRREKLKQAEELAGVTL